MAGKKEATAVVPKAEDTKAVAAYQYDEADLGAGFEDFDRSDLAIPFINILQKMSPQVDPDSPNYVDGAKAGMLINSVTGDLYDGKETGIIAIPVHRIHQFIEWIPRDSGGGFVAAYEVTDPIIIEAKREGQFGKLEHPKTGNDLVETFNVFSLLLEEGGDPFPGVVPFSSTQIKNYKRWMTKCRSIMIAGPGGRKFPAPMFAHTYRILTQFQENNKGTWHGYKISFTGEDAERSRLAPDSPLFKAAKDFRELVTSGVAQAAYSTAAQTDTDGGEDENDGGTEKPW